MSSQNFERGTFVYAGSSPEPALGKSSKKKRRQANVYDAVAGRVTTIDAPLSPTAPGPRRSAHGQYQLRDATLAPEEVLFARRGAPARYAEKDIYFAHGGLPDGLLPGSDVVKAAHGYASLFYEALAQRRRAAGRDDCFVGGRLVDERSMDETALLALGVLLEEAAREALGRGGDLVFTEGVPDGDGGDGGDRGAEEGDGGVQGDRIAVGLEDGEGFWKRPLPKRRKLGG